MSYLRDLCLFAYSGVQHILCCVFLRLVYPVLPVSLDCPFLVAPSVFSNVYLRHPITNLIGTCIFKLFDMLLISANAIRLESTNVQISMVTKTYKRQI
jgi:hypothetical protein